MAEEKELYLGIDGGQSHTEAVIADATGHVLGRGYGGPSNHADQPGGRERLHVAVTASVGEAAEAAGHALEKTVFAAAYCGMTGGADFKEQVIAAAVRARVLNVGHDAVTALAGAMAGGPGIVVIAGTGSVVYGRNIDGREATIGGLGYMFSDEGSGFWLAAQTVRLAVKERDGLIPESGLCELVTHYFRKPTLRDVTNAFYFGKIDRDQLASLAQVAAESADQGNQIVRAEIEWGAGVLAASVKVAAERLGMEQGFPVAGVGGMFRSRIMQESFSNALVRAAPSAELVSLRFGPAIGALLLAYRSAGVEVTGDMLANLGDGQ